jgi:hypothetical protein
MSAHFSKFCLNTYQGTPYFAANVPDDYPLSLVLQKCRAFRRLPPNLRKLAALAKEWAAKHHPDLVKEAEDWYDAAGNELDPGSGERLADGEIDAQWAGIDPPDIEVRDIPVPAGGFPDPETWQPQEQTVADGGDDPDRPTEARILGDIASHGRARTAREYGIPGDQLAGLGSDRELAQAILKRRG